MQIEREMQIQIPLTYSIAGYPLAYGSSEIDYFLHHLSCHIPIRI